VGQEVTHADRSLFVRHGLVEAFQGAVGGAVDVIDGGTWGRWLGSGVAAAEAPAESGRWAGHAGLWSRFLDALPGPVQWRRGGVGDQVPVDDGAEPSLQGPDRFFGAVALAEFAVMEGSARTAGVAELGYRAMCRAWLMARFPRRDSRWMGRFGFHEDHSMGAVPLEAAKRSAVGNRSMSPVWPINVAATTSPTPKMICAGRRAAIRPSARPRCGSGFRR
jgi:hypothetical protein